MALSKFIVTVFTKTDAPNNVLPNAPIEIRDRKADGTSDALSLIFSDSAGTIPITQTGATTDNLGQFKFFGKNDNYNAEFDNNGTPVVLAISPTVNQRTDRLNPDTLAIAIADDRLQLDDVLLVAEHTLGKGGGGTWVTVLLSTVTANTFDIVASTGVSVGAGALALVYRPVGFISADAVGFIPDGTDRADAYAAALDLAIATGLPLEIGVSTPALKYKIGSRVHRVGVSGLVIRGQGFNTLIDCAVAGDNVLSFNAGTAIDISGLNLDLTNTSSGNSFQGSGIFMIGCNKCKVKHNYGKNGKRSLVMFQDTTDSEIIANVVDGSTVPFNETSTDWGTALALVDSSSRNKVLNNYIKSNATGIEMQSINLGTNPKDNVVDNNIIEDSYVYAILAYRVNNADGADNNTITNNHILGVRGSILNVAAGNLSFGAGIYIQGAKHCDVSHNNIQDTNQDTDAETLAPGAIGVTNTTQCTVSNNTILSPNWYGIAIFDPLSNGVSNGITGVEDNTIEAPVKAGIFLKDRNDVNVTGNKVRNGLAQAILVRSTSKPNSSNIEIVDSKINNMGASGIDADLLRDSTVDTNNVRDCTVSCIAISDSARTSADTNKLRGGTVRGLHIDATCNDMSAIGNKISNSGVALLLQGPTIERDTIFNGNTTDYSGEWTPGSDDDGTATPNVIHKRFIRLVAGSNITNLLNGVPGQTIYFYASAARTLVNNAAILRLDGSVNFVMAVGDTLSLIKNTDGRWDETGRKLF